MSAKSTSSGISVGFPGLLCLLFITLKLCGVIDWSWLWVLSPLWIPVAIALVIVALCFAFAFIVACLPKRKRGNA
jgi:hypothetical protein